MLKRKKNCWRCLIQSQAFCGSWMYGCIHLRWFYMHIISIHWIDTRCNQRYRENMYKFICVLNIPKKGRIRKEYTRARQPTSMQTYECECDRDKIKCVDELLECISVGGHCIDIRFFLHGYTSLKTARMSTMVCKKSEQGIFLPFFFPLFNALIFNHLDLDNHNIQGKKSFSIFWSHQFFCSFQMFTFFFVRSRTHIEVSEREHFKHALTVFEISCMHTYCLWLICCQYHIEYYGI